LTALHYSESQICTIFYPDTVPPRPLDIQWLHRPENTRICTALPRCCWLELLSLRFVKCVFYLQVMYFCYCWWSL